jgi:thioredoxin reductase
MHDAIIIGAGPAGLQAALTLGRMHRTALVLDSGEYRNGTVLHMHNVVTNDGTPPARFRATAREQIAQYPTVEVRDVAAEEISGSVDAFRVRLADGSDAEARRILLATGLVDDLPPVPGLRELWGTRAFSCPFCDGHEHAGRPIAVIGSADRAEHLVSMLGRFVGEITVFPVGTAFAEDDRRMLESRSASVSLSPATAVSLDGADVRVTAGERTTTVDGIFVASVESRQRSPFAAQLGLRMLPSGAVEIDDFGVTSVPGILAAGDLAHRAALPGPMPAVTLAAAAGQLAATGIVRALMMDDH